MKCPFCGRELPDDARFCLSCGQPMAVVQSVESPEGARPALADLAMSRELFHESPLVDMELRETLLDCYLRFARSEELSDWLREINQDPKGSVEEKRSRVRAHTAYLAMTPATFPDQTIIYLRKYTADELAEICAALGLPDDGVKDDLFRRIYREVGYREGWLPRYSGPPDKFHKGTVLPFVKWYPILKAVDLEKELYDAFHEEMAEVFGDEHIHEQLPVAYGAALKIDFHIGHPNEGGVGIEFKMPKNNSDVQRALGQVDQYAGRYKEDLVVVFIPEFLTTADRRNFLDELGRKRIDVVVKQRT